MNPLNDQSPNTKPMNSGAQNPPGAFKAPPPANAPNNSYNPNQPQLPPSFDPYASLPPQNTPPLSQLGQPAPPQVPLANNPSPPSVLSLANLQIMNPRDVFNYFQELLRAGSDSIALQAHWQQYYSQLSPIEKEQVWRMDAGNDNLNQAAAPVSQTPPVPPPAGSYMPPNPALARPPPGVGFNNAQQPAFQTALYVEPVAIPDLPSPVALEGAEEIISKLNRKKQTDYNTYTESVQINARDFKTFFSLPVSLKKYGRFLPTKNPQAHPQAEAANIQAGTAPDAGVKKPLPKPGLGHKTRNMLIWNSSTALFDKEETSSIWRQNIKSIVFGAVVGVICLFVWQFAFFNERYIQPFVRPASLTTDTQIIISPNATKVAPGFKIIIPTIDIEAPVITGIDAYKSKDVNETEAQWEARIQKELESGVIHYPKTPNPGESGINENSNVVILGHSASTIGAPGDYKRIFSSLHTLKLDSLILVNYNEIQYIYKVKSVKIVKPSQIDVLESGKLNNSLTLITCHPPGSSSNRLILTAVQINPNPAYNLNIEVGDNKEGETIIPGKTKTFSDVIRGR